MKLVIEGLKRRIENSKLDIANAYVEFFGEEYRKRIIENVLDVEVLVYQNDLNMDIVTKFNYLLSFGDLNDTELEEFKKEIKYAKKYISVLDNFDKTLTNICRHYFDIPNTGFKIDDFIEHLKAFDKKILMSSNERLRLKKLFFKDLELDDKKELKDIISKEDFDDFKSALKRALTLKEKAILYIHNNLEELKWDLIYKGYEGFKLKEPKGTDSYCTYAKKGNKVVPICLFNFYNIAYGRESLYAHEFGHAIDMRKDLKKHGLLVNENYRLLNEALTDAIAKEVCKILKKNNKTVFIDKKSDLYKSKYSILAPVGKSLVDRFKEDLAKLKFGSEEEMYEIIDKETLLVLEELCVKAVYDETVSKEDKKRYIEEAVKIIENYKNTKNRY